MKQSFYDGTKLLSLKDINGDKPEIYMCTSNRSAGKTTYFNRLCVNRFIKYKEKFCVLYRFNYELSDCADKFFKDIGGLFFPDMYMSSKNRAKGVYHELYLNEEPCGYAMTINAADSIKKMSHLFSDTVRIVFDEFQSETNHYCPDEVNKFISIHTSIARGAGKQSRYVPVYMISNPVTLLNPYYTQMGIADRLTEKTKFLRGEGYVLEQGYNEAASNAQKESALDRTMTTICDEISHLGSKPIRVNNWHDAYSELKETIDIAAILVDWDQDYTRVKEPMRKFLLKAAKHVENTRPEFEW
jgi:hypothetical protein